MAAEKLERILISFKPTVRIRDLQPIFSKYQYEEILSMERSFYLYVPAGKLFEEAEGISKEYGHLLELQELPETGRIF